MFFEGFEKRAQEKKEEDKIRAGRAAGIAGLTAAAGVGGYETVQNIRAGRKVSEAPKMTRAQLQKSIQAGDIIMTANPSRLTVADMGMRRIVGGADAKPAIAAVGGSPYYHSEVAGYTKGKKGKGRKVKIMTAIGPGEKSMFSGKKGRVGKNEATILVRVKDKEKADLAAKRVKGLSRRGYGSGADMASYTTRSLLGLEGPKGDKKTKPRRGCNSKSGLLCHQLTGVAHQETLPRNTAPRSMILNKDIEVIGRYGTPSGKLRAAGNIIRPLARAGVAGLGVAGLTYGGAKSLNYLKRRERENPAVGKKEKRD